MKSVYAMLLVGLLSSGSALAAEGDSVNGTLEGDGITGEISMLETASGTVHIKVSAQGVPEGAHGIHVHEVGKCEAADGFKSAGGHLAAGLDHGIQSDDGPHPGDLPNVHAGAQGMVNAEFFVRGFSLGTEGDPRILDQDGSSVILHAGPDDYTSQPSGDSGSRIACAVLKAAE
ncbi:superoxide dismutase family protein [Hoeflea sp. YIM 152468]|uniref:superoxide dismutase family protein n=1 Tax=Hoeflea sp. YIM 152468 TaxID=3031759 RepID=UPI0023DB863C|nr:superoxide dismutase family protein [Hoeflea sp. YIM 152468]MDF1609387.1 superoxide dismutase family protein [Hoeflea sp. YIM 152468]